MTEGRGGREEKNKNFRVSRQKKVFRFSVFAFGVLIRYGLAGDDRDGDDGDDELMNTVRSPVKKMPYYSYKISLCFVLDKVRVAPAAESYLLLSPPLRSPATDMMDHQSFCSRFPKQIFLDKNKNKNSINEFEIQ